MKSLFLLLVFLSAAWSATVDIQINSGPVNATIRGNIVTGGYQFNGIFYAKAPVGDLRFEPAVFVDPSGLVDATRGRAQCLQHSDNTEEDCLHIMILTPPNVTSTSNFATYVYIHGGALVAGGNGLSGGSYHNLVNRGPMVIVSVSYRLGPLGFFSTRTSVVPGNVGVSDWIAALTWVQKYIRFFGGNPNKVTIGGQSAGGWSVSALTMTRAADSLWHQSIAHSGSIFDSGVMSYDEMSRDASRRLAVQAGCATLDQWNGKEDAVMKQIVACLKNKTGAEIIEADNHVNTGTGWKWGFVQDTKYFPDRLEKIAMTRPPKPALLGVCHDEDHGWIEGNVLNGHMSGYTATFVETSVRNSHDMSFWNNKQQVIDGAVQAYVTSQTWATNDSINWAAQYVKMWSDIQFIGPTRRDANYYAKTGSKVFLYSFDFLTPLAEPNITDPRLRGVPHSWDLQYVFGTPRYNTPDDTATYELCGKLWTNFILYGNPTPATGGIPTGVTWPEIGTNNAFFSLGPKPMAGQDFHPSSKYWACDAPQLDGHPNPYCS